VNIGIQATADPALARALATLAEVAGRLGAAEVAEQVAEADRLAALVFEVAVVGEFKRGKSSLINALLGRQVLHQGAAGATALRGIWGYHGNHPPHGDRLLTLRRRVPVLTVVVDTPTRIRSWFGIVDELTDQTGLVTCEMVPAFRAGDHRGGLRLSTIPASDTRGTAR